MQRKMSFQLKDEGTKKLLEGSKRDSRGSEAQNKHNDDDVLWEQWVSCFFGCFSSWEILFFLLSRNDEKKGPTTLSCFLCFISTCIFMKRTFRNQLSVLISYFMYIEKKIIRLRRSESHFKEKCAFLSNSPFSEKKVLRQK